MTGILGKLKEQLGKTVTGDFQVQHWLDTGFPPLNLAISGDYYKGLPCGRIVEMFGPPSSGKTAIATAAMAEVVKKGGFAMFFDHERSFDINIARDLGLDDSTGMFAHLKPDTLEEAFTRAILTAKEIRTEGMVDEDAPIIAVFDSLAAMIPKSKSDKELTEFTMADSLALAKATSSVMPSVNQAAEKYDMLVLILNQVRENPGVSYGDPTRTPGGKAPGFYASVRISLRSQAITQLEDGKKERLGHRITAEVIKNKVAKPFEKAAWDFLYEGKDGHFDVIGGLIDHLEEIGAIEYKKPRYSYAGKQLYKSQLIEHIRKGGGRAELEALLPKTEPAKAA